MEKEKQNNTKKKMEKEDEKRKDENPLPHYRSRDENDRLYEHDTYIT
jgi:hypothetical protein